MASSSTSRSVLPFVLVPVILVVAALAVKFIGVGATLTVAALAATAAMFVVLINLTGFGR